MNDYLLRQKFKRMGLLPVVHAIKPMLTLLNYKGFQQLRRITANLPLGPLLKNQTRFLYQPRFLYKYLAPYAAASFDRSTRLAIIINHYKYLIDRTNAYFFPAMLHGPVLWRHSCGEDECTISLSYPLHVANEAELSLHFFWNSTLIQVVSFVITPGAVVGATSPQVLLFGQVQGFANATQLRDITKALHDITPAMLLVHAAYGLASALQIGGAAGVSKQNKVGQWLYRHFDYDAFWLDLKGEWNADADLFLLPVPPPERPIEECKRNHRARTLRKRLFKERVREEIAQHWQATFSVEQPCGAEAVSAQDLPQSGQRAMVSA